jgi:molybdenum cofactor guanylyltransferase
MLKEGFTAIILAGGKSSRIGTNKALLNYQGKRLIDVAVEKAQLLTNNISISSNTFLPGVEYRQIADSYPGIGPIAGICSCLRKSDTKWNLILACDMPEVPVSFLQQMIPLTTDFQAVVPRLGESHLEPLAAFYHHSALPVIEGQIKAGDYKMTNLIEKLNTNYYSCTQSAYFKNINTLKDLG